MTVSELIAQLQACPPDLEVRIWDELEDDYVPIGGAFFEDGATSVDILDASEYSGLGVLSEVTP